MAAISGHKILELGTVILMIFLTFSLVYSVHFDYRYPFHVDEWQHIAQAVKIIDIQDVNAGNPYFKNFPQFRDIESGFHIFLAELFLLTGADPVLFYKYLPAIFASISAFMLFLFILKLTENFYISVFGMIFFASLKSNINILGLWFLVPMTFSIPLIYLSFMALINGLEKNRPIFLFIFGIISLSIIIIHPVSLTFMIPIVFFYSLIRYKTVLQNIWNIIPLLIASLLIVSALFFNYFWKNSVSDTIDYMYNTFVFKHGWGIVEINYSLSEFYGTTSLILAIIGLILSVKKRLWMPILWSISTLSLLYMFTTFGFSVLAPYQRILYYNSLGFVTLSAMGLYLIIILIHNALKNIIPNFPYRESFINILLIVLMTSLLYGIFSNYYKTPDNLGVYKVINDDAYNAIKQLENYGNNNIILADSWISTAIYPISKNYVVSFTPAHLWGEKLDDVDIFLENSSCSRTDRIAKKFRVDFILARNEIRCENFENIYDKKTYIYEVKDRKIREQYINLVDEYAKNKSRLDIMEKLGALGDMYSNTQYSDDIVYSIGEIYKDHGNCSKAVDEYKMVLNYYNNSDIIDYALYELGECYTSLGNYTLALEKYNTILNRYPDSELAKNALIGIGTIYLYNLHNYSDAVITYKKFLDKYPKSGYIHIAEYRIAESYHLMKNYTLAIDGFSNYISKYPDSDFVDNALFKIADSYYRIGDYTSAINNFEKLIKSYPKSELINETLEYITSIKRTGK